MSLTDAGQEKAVVRLKLVAANRHPRMVGVDPLLTRSNYFLGNDPSQWRTGITHYAQVRVEGVYPGVDMVYRGNQRQLEYDLLIAPGADPKRIQLAFSGADSITIGAQGQLILHTANGNLVQHAPVAYQEIGDQQQRVESRYVLLTQGGEPERHPRVGFALGRYDRTRPLIIDPVLVYSTFLGGSGDDLGYDIAVDSDGNTYISGMTSSITFPGISGNSIRPANGGGFDAFVTKINSTGTAIVYSTFLGGSGFDQGIGLAVDNAMNAYVTGQTTSTTFPGISGSSIQSAYGGGGDDAFVTKINSTGTAIVYSTFLGGSGNDAAFGIAVDGVGNSYITGLTTSTAAFPGVSGSSLQPANGGGRDAFVTKINSPGTAIAYSTFLGGSGDDFGYSIAVDDTDSAYVTGQVTSTTLPGISGTSIQPTNGGGGDAFAIKINSTGTAIVYSTFFGGSEDELGLGVAVDGMGNAYVSGQTSSTTLPGVSDSSIQEVNGGEGDAFLTKINALGTAIVYSTFLGGSETDQAYGIAVDGTGNAYVTGQTFSSNFPGVSGINSGNSDAFVTKTNSTGTAIAYSILLGGSESDSGYGIAVDSSGNAYITGGTASTTLQGINDSSIQPTNSGSGDSFIGDAFLTKVGALFAPTITTQASPTVMVGGSISDTATLAGGSSPTGTISFMLFGPDNANCAGTPIFTSTKAVSGNGSYPSDSFVTSSAGTYRWVAIYSGDANNATAGPTSCDDPAETVIVTAPGDTACKPNPTTLCIDNQVGDRRFELRVHYSSPARHLEGDARATALSPLGITQGGVFSFFSSSNPEMLIKVLNGCSLGGHYWVFLAAVTDVGFTVTARDTVTGVTRTYSNIDGQAAASVLDTSAFACHP